MATRPSKPAVTAVPVRETPFKWGDFAQLMDAMCFNGKITEMRQPEKGVEFGRLELNESAGEGNIEYLRSDSMRIIVFDCTFHQPYTFYVVDDGWVRFNFSLRAAVDMAFGGYSRVNVLEPSCRFISVPPDELTVENVIPGAWLRWVTVCCRPEMLGRLADVRTDDLPLRDTGSSTDVDGFAYRPFRFTPALKSAASDIISMRPRGGLRSAYVAVKAQELLVLGLDGMLNGHPAEMLSQQVKLAERDIEALNVARAILDSDLANPPTVADLALRVGLNRNKLFYGFKSLFGVSISEHLQERRIARGHALLVDTDMPISEIAMEIGFRHQCNFSTAFRARHRMTPSQLRARRTERPAKPR